MKASCSGVRLILRVGIGRISCFRRKIATLATVANAQAIHRDRIAGGGSASRGGAAGALSSSIHLTTTLFAAPRMPNIEFSLPVNHNQFYDPLLPEPRALQ